MKEVKDYTEEQQEALYNLSIECHKRGGNIDEYITLEDMVRLYELGLYIKWEEGKFAGIRPE